MKICIPVTESKGLQSPLSAHFGSAPFFVVADTDNNTHTIVANNNAEHEHGQCGQFPVISQHKASTVICNGMGKRALDNLNKTHVKVYIPDTICTTAQDVIAAFNNGKCRELLPDAACGHGHDHEHESHDKGKGCHH